MVNESFGAIKDIKILNKEKDILEYYNKSRNKLEKNLFYFTVFEGFHFFVARENAVFGVLVFGNFVICVSRHPWRSNGPG